MSFESRHWVWDLGIFLMVTILLAASFSVVLGSIFWSLAIWLGFGSVWMLWFWRQWQRDQCWQKTERLHPMEVALSWQVAPESFDLSLEAHLPWPIAWVPSWGLRPWIRVDRLWWESLTPRQQRIWLWVWEYWGQLLMKKALWRWIAYFRWLWAPKGSLRWSVGPVLSHPEVASVLRYPIYLEIWHQRLKIKSNTKKA